MTQCTPPAPTAAVSLAATEARPQAAEQTPRTAECPKCGGPLELIHRHIGGHGSQPHALCPECGYQRRLLPILTDAPAIRAASQSFTHQRFTHKRCTHQRFTHTPQENDHD